MKKRRLHKFEPQKFKLVNLPNFQKMSTTMVDGRRKIKKKD